MTPERTLHLRNQIGTALCLDELDGMRRQISDQGEMTTEIMQAIRDRQDALFRMGFRKRG